MSYISLLVFHKFNKIRHLRIKSPFRRYSPHIWLSTPFWAVMHLCPGHTSQKHLPTWHSAQSPESCIILGSAHADVHSDMHPRGSLIPWLSSTLDFNAPSSSRTALALHLKSPFVFCPQPLALPGFSVPC